MIFQADLLPHYRRRGSDPCNVPEAAGCDGFHIFRVIVQCFHKIDKRRCDNVGQMAHTCSDEIVLLCSEHHRNGPKGADQLCEISNIFQPNFAAWSKNIVSVLQNALIGMVESGFLRTSHWMTADEAVCHSKFLNLLVDDSLYASHICNDASVLTDLL